MKMLNNFLKKFNNPVPVFAQTKMEKETQNEDASSTKPKTTFIDVAGLDEVKEELFEIVDFMKDNTMNDVNMQIQLHKIIWAPDKRGV